MFGTVGSRPSHRGYLPVTNQTLTSTGTYRTPLGCKRIEVSMVAGGGGAGGVTNGSPGAILAGSDGTASSFSSITANPGKGANGATATSSVSVGLGGTAGTGTATRRQAGYAGKGGVISVSGGLFPFGAGGDSVLGPGAAPPLALGANINGVNAAANTGGGGSGAIGGTSTDITGGGGGAGEFVYHLINNPAPTYSYTIGGGGAGGIGANSTGGAGGSGVIYVKEYYA